MARVMAGRQSQLQQGLPSAAPPAPAAASRRCCAASGGAEAGGQALPDLAVVLCLLHVGGGQRHRDLHSLIVLLQQEGARSASSGVQACWQVHRLAAREGSCQA